MDIRPIPLQRLRSQQLEQTQLRLPPDVVNWMVAVQAQDYAGAKWSLGLRLPKSTDLEIEQSISDKAILRSWVLRGTLHFVTSSDLNWLLQLVGPGVIAGNTRRYRELELDEATLKRSNDLLARTLQREELLTRKELLSILRQNGISTEGQRGVYMLQRASLDGLICQGVMRANNPTFMRMEGFASGTMARAEALAELARRYFTSHGPATLQDFTWWSGLRAAEARDGLESIQSELLHDTVEGKTYWWAASSSPFGRRQQSVLLLPGFDEFLLAYRDRSASLGVANYNQLASTGGMLPGTIVIGGKVVGTWKRTIKKGSVIIDIHPFKGFSPVEDAGLVSAGKRLGEYLGLEAVLQ